MKPINIIVLFLLAAATCGRAGAGTVFENDWAPPQPLLRLPVIPPVAPAPPVPAPPAHAPIPPKNDQARARILLKEVFAKQLADKTIPGRRKLAQILLAQAQQPGNGLTEKFMLLVGSLEAARDGANLRLCFEAADMMGSGFVVDELAIKLDMTRKMDLRGESSETASENMLAALDLLEMLSSAEDFVDAIHVAAILRPLSLVDPEMRTIVQKRSALLDTVRAAHDRALVQVRTLATTPDDAGANLDVGTYYCFHLGQWEKGMPFLARAADPHLKSVAEREIVNPQNPDDIGRIADGWFDIAATKTEIVRARILQHALSYYKRAVPAAVGLRRALMEKRIADGEKELDRLLPDSETAAAKPPPLAPDAAAAVNRAVAYILSQQKPDGSWETGPVPKPGAGGIASIAFGGETALAVYALLAAGLDPASNPSVKAGLDALTKLDVTGVYVLSLRMQALSRAPHPVIYQDILNKDFDRLATGMTRDHGVFGYRVPSAGLKAAWDLSNTQYGWIGLAVNKGRAKALPWSIICDFLITHQNPDGTWAYNNGMEGGSASMTAAGATLLMLGREQMPKSRGTPRLEASLAAGLKWLDAHHGRNGQSITNSNYYLLEIQRVGQLTGRKAFNNVDWYVAGCDSLIKAQSPTGAWGSVHDTAMGIIFLVDGGVR